MGSFELEPVLPIDPFKVANIEFISVFEAGFTWEEISRLANRGIEVQYFRVHGEDAPRLNFPAMPCTDADRFTKSIDSGLVSDDQVFRFLNDARYVESDDTFRIAWLDFIK